MINTKDDTGVYFTAVVHKGGSARDFSYMTLLVGGFILMPSPKLPAKTKPPVALGKLWSMHEVNGFFVEEVYVVVGAIVHVDDHEVGEVVCGGL